MKRSRKLVSVVLAGAAFICAVASASAEDDRPGRKIVTVAFGAGLNTAQPGNPQNHHILPRIIELEAGDVINFVVAGLHVIRVYDRGVELHHVRREIPDECEVNPIPPDTFPSNCFIGPPPVPVIPQLGLAVHYEGLNPMSPPETPPFAPRSTAENRVESVAFLRPGRYLVICAVLPHFNDRMRAWVEVRPRGETTTSVTP